MKKVIKSLKQGFQSLLNGQLPKSVWQEFCSWTTIHGFVQIFYSKTMFRKRFWALLLLTMFGLLIYSCSNSIMQYYQYDVKTTIVHNTFSQIEFPAITFCNQNRVSRSVAGADDIALWLDIMMNAQSMEEMYTPLAEQEKYCQPDNGTMSRIPLSANNNMTLLSISKIFARDSFNSIEKCWWNNAEIECRTLFINHILDYGLCFTFNYDTVFQTQKLVDITALGYGVNESDVLPNRNITIADGNAGLKLLMNTNESEYCGLMGKWRGVGILAMIHDRQQIFPSFFQTSHMFLQPGYIHNIVLTPTIFRRNTAYLDRCTNPIYRFGDYHYYSLSLCRGLCFLTIAVKNCRCVSSLTTGAEKFFSTQFGIPLDKYPICATVNQFLCLKQAELDIINNPGKYCSICKQACFETTYETLITSIKLRSSSYHFDKMMSQKDLEQEKIDKNFMLNMFTFQSMSVMIVEEQQSFTISDLFIYIGSAIGLFIGMSFMSFGDILQYLVFGFIKFCRKRKNKINFKQRNAVTTTNSSYII